DRTRENLDRVVPGVPREHELPVFRVQHGGHDAAGPGQELAVLQSLHVQQGPLWANSTITRFQLHHGDASASRRDRAKKPTAGTRQFKTDLPSSTRRGSFLKSYYGTFLWLPGAQSAPTEPARDARFRFRRSFEQLVANSLRPSPSGRAGLR